MAFADFAGDWDWTENAAEDEQTDDSKKGMAVSRPAVFFTSMF